MININITDEDQLLNEILLHVGYPVLDYTKDLPYSKDQIKTLFIWPAMREFFIHWPKRHIEEYPVVGNYSFDFPDDTTFGVLDARMNTNAVSSGTNFSTDPLAYTRNLSQVQGGVGRGKYGTPYNYDSTRSFYSRRAEYQGAKNAEAITRYDLDQINKKLSGYSNVGGRMTVTWAKFSYNWDEIPFDKLEDCIKLASSNLMKAWGSLLSMQSSDLSNELDGQSMIDRAEELKESVIGRWNVITRPVILRTK